MSMIADIDIYIQKNVFFLLQNQENIFSSFSKYMITYFLEIFYERNNLFLYMDSAQPRAS